MWSKYCQIPLIKRMLVSFITGALFGLCVWYIGNLQGVSYQEELASYIAPFGAIFVQMLKMVVVPIVFFSLLLGAAKLPISHLGNLGVRLLVLYLVTSLIGTIVGISAAFIIDPGSGTGEGWQQLLQQLPSTEKITQTHQNTPGFFSIILSMFSNPFASLAESNFLGLIVFAILLGLAFSAISDSSSEESENTQIIMNALSSLNTALHKVVSWIMEYAPIGVLALSCVNFGVYGPAIIGPYLKVVIGIILGILVMVFGVYAIMIKLLTKTSPKDFFIACKEPMITAFVTRSSAAALPISMKAATDKLGIPPHIASFALPLGATINMDGVCVHLPMFAILTANLFGIVLDWSDLCLLVVTTVLAAIGTGGVPGGSLMLLFLVLGALGLGEDQIAAVVSLALGVNPILDMFETMNNVTGDLMCAKVIAEDQHS